MYRAFNPTEMEMIAGYIRGCQHIEVAVRGDNDKKERVILRFDLVPLPANISERDMARPYTMLERFLEAVKIFNNVKKVKFENCKYHANNNTIEAIGKLDAKREAASKAIFEAIKNCDEAILDKMWEKHKAALTGTKLGFKECKFQPLETHSNISDLEDFASEKNQTDEVTASEISFQEPIVTQSASAPFPIAVEEKRKAGRPRKNPL